MSTRGVILSTLASAAALGAGFVSWSVPHAAQAAAVQASASAASAAAKATASASASSAAVASSSASASATATPSSAATVPYGGYTGTVTGNAVTMQYGTVQVSVTLAAGTITDVTVLQAPSGRNQMYTNRAVPVLHSEALSAQSANISIVSGATFVSGAYIQSLQSALDQL